MSEEITYEEYNNFVRGYDLDIPEIESGAIFPEIERRLFQTIKDLKNQCNNLAMQLELESGESIAYMKERDDIHEIYANECRRHAQTILKFEAAKAYIDASPCDPDITPEQIDAYAKYKDACNAK